MRRTVEELKELAQATASVFHEPRCVDSGEWYEQSDGVRYCPGEGTLLAKWRVATCPQAIIELCAEVDKARRLMAEVQEQLMVQCLDLQEVIADVEVELNDRDVTIMPDGQNKTLNLLRKALRERAASVSAAQVCPECQGRGNTDAVLCSTCRGSGRVD